MNLRQDYDEAAVEVAYRFYPDTEVISETWTPPQTGPLLEAAEDPSAAELKAL